MSTLSAFVFWHLKGSCYHGIIRLDHTTGPLIIVSKLSHPYVLKFGNTTCENTVSGFRQQP